MLSDQILYESEHSVSRYIEGLRAGNNEATQKIWERFIQRLVQLANRKLSSTPRSSADGEDVVQQAFSEFFMQVQEGRFPKLHDRDDLWQILAMLVDRRAKDQIRRQTTQRAGGGKVINVTGAQNDKAAPDPILSMPSRSPNVHEAMEFVDTLREHLTLLTEEQQEVALLKLQGYSNKEIAVEITSNERSISLRTVERTLGRIRSHWEDVWDTR
jgi:RNA polymerase sigma factor (sigma-70 family)